ncbi:Type IV fimbrial biogenesis protein PilW [Candidatus Nitrotoga sp. HW29]|uniref:PilW family protein n=1 Tax=Candidatus Nitrotoga sp. HW29 TaxID=2886963 RepID=UPI001EF36429|nr:PilW family protein [Candidatus Nitrotoga sp. HW29]CAH1904749.1 Type IV fimbrial biogenesis protein PilW [Candidatus Nitrotoga sp. HW29]
MNQSDYLRIFKNRISQRGLSLVELMISITIGLLILSALATLFVNQSKTRTELDKSNRLIDNGRYAVEVLSENLRLAGFYGERELIATGVINDPCTTTPTNPSVTEMRDALGLHVAGYDASSVVATIGTPPCGLTSAELKPGSDILVLRRADNTSISAASALSGTHYIQLSNCKYDVATSVIGKTASDFILRERNCTSTSTLPAANVRRFFVQTYFVSPNNIAGDGIPTLKLKELDPAGTGVFIITPLVEGIEYLQVEYGIDGDNNADGVMDDINGDTVVSDGDKDGAADSYVTSCATVECWSNIVSVRLNVIARNIETTAGHTNTNISYTLGQAGTFGPFNDSYKRHVFAQTVRLINRSGQRERP